MGYTLDGPSIDEPHTRWAVHRWATQDMGNTWVGHHIMEVVGATSVHFSNFTLLFWSEVFMKKSSQLNFDFVFQLHFTLYLLSIQTLLKYSFSLYTQLHFTSLYFIFINTNTPL